jgi:murein DD-endopeptidase MepM/ murein hydrolase activator NlpD
MMRPETHSMPDDKFLEHVPGIEAQGSRIDKEGDPNAALGAETAQESRILMFWERLSSLGLAESALRLGTHLLSLSMVLLVVWLMREFYLRAQVAEPPRDAALAASLPTPTPTAEPPKLPAFAPPESDFLAGIPRYALMHTTIPTRPRTEVITYTVQTGDTIFGIAENFGLKPETIMWGNTYILGDNPHYLSPGQELNILPVDGVYHKWSAGEGLNGVSEGYGVKPEDIINYPGNHLNPDTLGNWSDPNIEPGTFLIVPGGHREFINFSPRITRDNPSVAKFIGPGACDLSVDPLYGLVGTGGFIWPSANHFLSGYDFSPATNHYGIDIKGNLGDAMWASDSGVVVYAGWNNFGYGNMVVIDHGNGWQTLYGHMSVIGVGCGQNVAQGDMIGAIGSTGKSSGPHIHFEMMHDSYGKVNPWDFLPPP